VSLEELLLRHAAGQDVSGARLETGAHGVMMIPVPRAGVFAGVTGVDRARALPGVEDVEITAKEGQALEPWPEGSSYPGFIFARGNSPSEVERTLRTAHDRLEFQVSAALPIVR